MSTRLPPTNPTLSRGHSLVAALVPRSQRSQLLLQPATQPTTPQQKLCIYPTVATLRRRPFIFRVTIPPPASAAMISCVAAAASTAGHGLLT